MSGLDNTSYTVRTSVATSETLTNNDYVVLYTNTAAKAVTVPAASSVQPGRPFALINTNTGAVTITPSSGLIDGQATQTVAAGAVGAYHGRIISNDGTNWFTVDSY